MLKRSLAALLAVSVLLLTGCAGGLPFRIKTPDPTAPSKPLDPVVPADSAPEPLPQDAQDCTDFAAVMTRLLDDGRTNAALSPLSAYVALAMAAEGADGETKAQFEAVLGADSAQIRRAVALIAERLTDVRGSTRLTLAQSVWTDQRVRFKDEFLDTLETDYKADMFSGLLSSSAIRDAINRWVSDRTNGLIRQLLDDNLSDDAVLALINTLYFKGRWATQFNERTFKGAFTTADGREQEAEYMSVLGHFGYIDLGDARGVVLPYDDGRTVMLALMPNDSTAAPSTVLTAHDCAELAKAAQSSASEYISLTLPKFETESSFELKQTLRRMGLTDAFEPALADFARTGADDICISRVLQKVKLIVDTEGTEAAAATAVILEKATAIPVQPMILDFDRPFVYLVMDVESAIPLFTGVFNSAK